MQPMVPEMPRMSLRFMITGLVAALMLTSSACGDGRALPSEVEQETNVMSMRIDGDGGEALVIDPRTATLPVSSALMIKARITGPDGHVLPNARASWRSTDEAVLSVYPFPDSVRTDEGDDRAHVFARSAGTARVIASYGNVADTVTITVLARTIPVDSTPAPPPVDTIITPPPPGDTTIAPPPPPVDTIAPPPPPSAWPIVFDAVIDVSTAVDTTLLALWVREPVVGATVRVVQLPLRPTDVVPDGAARVSQPTLVGTAVTDTAGFVRITNIPMSRFRIEVQPPAGSAWEPGMAEYGPVGVATMYTRIRLPRH